MSQTYKNFFSRTVQVPGGVAVALGTLMLAKGFAVTDSFVGEQQILTPTNTLYLGDDENVRDADGAGVYKGQPFGAGDSINLADYRDSGAVGDPMTTWLYSPAAQDLGVVYSGL